MNRGCNEMGVTQEIIDFATSTEYDSIPFEVVEHAKRHVLDSLAVTLAGSLETGPRLLIRRVKEMELTGQASLIGCHEKAPPTFAALVNGTSGHVLDYDDTQLSTSTEAVFGLLTHPSVPVLSAVLALGEALSATGRDVLTAYIVGVEATCRVADAIQPDHYKRGFHSSGTIGTLGSTIGAAKLLDLDDEKFQNALGIAASMAAGLRESFGTMTKSLHVGRAAEGGLMAATLAQDGYTAARDVLEAKRGFFRAMAGGFREDKIKGQLGNPYFFINPGIAIKPYPSGSLSHPAMDLARSLVEEHAVRAEEVEEVEVRTTSIIPDSLIYDEPQTPLEAKFCLPYCIAITLLRQKPGIREFSSWEVLEESAVKNLLKRVKVIVDPGLESAGYDRMNTIISVKRISGETITVSGHVARGHPVKPMTRGELENKFRDCASEILSESRIDAAMSSIWGLEELHDVRDLIACLTVGDRLPVKPP